MSRGAVGRRGEHLAGAFLAARGYVVLATNVRTPYGEVDVLCREGAVLVAVEVKTRRSTAFGLPEESVTPTKLAHIAASMEHYLQEQHDEGATDWRIDVVAIDLERTGRAAAIRLLRGVDGARG